MEVFLTRIDRYSTTSCTHSLSMNVTSSGGQVRRQDMSGEAAETRDAGPARDHDRLERRSGRVATGPEQWRPASGGGRRGTRTRLRPRRCAVTGPGGRCVGGKSERAAAGSVMPVQRDGRPASMATEAGNRWVYRWKRRETQRRFPSCLLSWSVCRNWVASLLVNSFVHVNLLPI